MFIIMHPRGEEETQVSLSACVHVVGNNILEDTVPTGLICPRPVDRIGIANVTSRYALCNVVA